MFEKRPSPLNLFFGIFTPFLNFWLKKVKIPWPSAYQPFFRAPWTPQFQGFCPESPYFEPYAALKGFKTLKRGCSSLIEPFIAQKRTQRAFSEYRQRP